MKYNYTVKIDGKWYPAGTEIPEKDKKPEVPEPSEKPSKKKS